MNKNIENLGKAVLRKKVYIVLITMILVATGVFYTLTNVTYVANQKILVGESDDRIETYQELIKGSMVLEKVIEKTR